ncbi:hypothetical protein M9H77_26574 [Catharanthus roseus]|uniref:Uncharacterized protein n=1 Tax=Catharanthus roseus TaxID=4058 RepID=A0ACC0AE44_CATRO|nr:hypothetical protein M9H77_26574 [Catharanthus roseus]
MVRSPVGVSGIGNNVYTLRMNNTSCSCRKWQTYTLSCSHAFAVCRENGTRADTYVPEIYSRQTYRRTYQANFNPVLSENFWRDVPYNLTFYPSNMNKERGMKQGMRFQGEMDYRNSDSPLRCGRYHMPGHNRKNCNNPGSKSLYVITGLITHSGCALSARLAHYLQIRDLPITHNGCALSFVITHNHCALWPEYG